MSNIKKLVLGIYPDPVAVKVLSLSEVEDEVEYINDLLYDMEVGYRPSVIKTFDIDLDTGKPYGLGAMVYLVSVSGRVKR